MLVWPREAFITLHLDPGRVRFIGLRNGWATVAWPLIIILLFALQGWWLFAWILAHVPWLIFVVPASIVGALGYHFDVTLQSEGVLARTRFWGIVVSSEFFSPGEVEFEFSEGYRDGFGDEDSQDRVTIRSSDDGRSITFGDNFSAFTLHQDFRETWGRVRQQPDESVAPQTLTGSVPAPTDNRPVDIRQVASKALSVFRSEPLLFVEGWSREATRRVGIFVRHMGRVRLIFDGYVDSGQVEGLRERIAQDVPLLDADWDEMAHTARRRYVWTTAPFALYFKGRQHLTVASQSLLLGERMIHKHEVEKVLAVFTGGKMGVDLELNTGERVKVARHICWGAIFDPLYDSWELEFDTIWSESLAQSLAEAVDVDWTRQGY